MERKRKILIIGSAYPYRGGGIATFNERLAGAFIEYGFEIMIYTFTLQYPKIFFPGKFQKTSEPGPTNLTIKRKINSVNPVNWLNIGNEIRKSSFEIVIFRYWTPFMAPCFGTIARMIKKNHRTRIFTITDNIIPHEPGFFDKILSKYFVNSMDGFITMSKSVLNDLKQFDQTKPKLYLPHPLYDIYDDPIPKDMAKTKLGLDTDIGYILFFGFVREYKGLDLLIKALDDDRLRKMKIKLLVAGEFYENFNKYDTLVRTLNLEEMVIMPNKFIPNNDIVNYFSACDIVIQPYKSATQSGVTQTAYHFNKPMITTNVGGLSEIVPHDVVGYIVKPEPSEISDAIHKFYTLNKEEEFSKNVSKIKKNFGWGKMINAIDELYKKLKTSNK